MNERIQSIDVFRGLTMFLLIGEFTGLYSLLGQDSLEGGILGAIGLQLHHHPWNGLRFWDLIQPFFMFIVGLSLPFAVSIRRNKGASDKQILRHVLKRSAILVVLGWALYCIGPGEITFRFQNVLAQIGFTYLVAYLVMERSFRFQVLFSFGLILFSDLLYRLWPVEGFDQPFVLAKNFGTWLDTLYGGENLTGGWVAFNAVPTAAHTIWGVLAGKLLMSDSPDRKKLMILLLTGAALILIGYLMNPFIPIIKRICTSSFVIVSGGYCILAMGVFYGIIDILKWNGKWTAFFIIVGMNSLFIYLFAHLDGGHFIENILHPFTHALFASGGTQTAEILTALLVWLALWGICYWMYRKRLFIKI